MTDTARSTRPASVVQSDIDVTRRGAAVTEAVVLILLAQRNSLLAEGWPPEHALCLELDRDAARWAARGESMRRALRDLNRELHRT